MPGHRVVCAANEYQDPSEAFKNLVRKALCNTRHSLSESPEQHYDAHATCPSANPQEQIFVRSASDPFAAVQPDAGGGQVLQWDQQNT